MAKTATLTPNPHYGWDATLTITAKHADTFGSIRAYEIRKDGRRIGWTFSRPGSTHSKAREWDFTTEFGTWQKPGTSAYPHKSQHDAAAALLENTMSAISHPGRN